MQSWTSRLIEITTKRNRMQQVWKLKWNFVMVSPFFFFLFFLLNFRLSTKIDCNISWKWEMIFSFSLLSTIYLSEYNRRRIQTKMDIVKWVWLKIKHGIVGMNFFFFLFDCLVNHSSNKFFNFQLIIKVHGIFDGNLNYWIFNLIL